MNKLEKLISELQQHAKNHKGKECELFVGLPLEKDEAGRERLPLRELTGSVSTFSGSVVIFAGEPYDSTADFAARRELIQLASTTRSARGTSSVCG